MGFNVYFTGDEHIFHKNIVRGCSEWTDKSGCRDFNTIEEHDAYVINERNKMVRPCDTLYSMGDLGFGVGNADKFRELRSLTKCENFYVCKGNHDHIFDSKHNKDGSISALFKDVRDIYYKKICGRFFVLCHYAMLTYPWQHHGSIHLHGHSHGSLPNNEQALTLDVGVDTEWYGHKKYTPYSIEEIFHIMDTHKKYVALDHHKA